MSWKASSYIKEMLAAPNGESLTRDEKFFALMLADYHNTHHKKTWPSMSRLAEECLSSESHTKRILASLVRKGVIAKVRPVDQGRGMLCEYTFPAIDEEGVLLRPLLPTERGSEGVLGSNALKEELELQFKTSPPSSEGVKKQKLKPSQDERYTQFIEIISNGYKRHDWPFTWDGRSGEQLKRLLKSLPTLTAEKFKVWLTNYFKSDGVVPGGVPYLYLSKLPNYWKGPLNKFGKLTDSDTVCAATENMR